MGLIKTHVHFEVSVAVRHLLRTWFLLRRCLISPYGSLPRHDNEFTVYKSAGFFPTPLVEKMQTELRLGGLEKTRLDENIFEYQTSIFFK